MTLIVALKCKGGMVFGADGMGTVVGEPRVGQPLEKLYDLGGEVLWAGAGDTAMVQTLDLMFEQARAGDKAAELPRPGPPLDFCAAAKRYVLEVQRSAVEDHVENHPRARPERMAAMFGWVHEGESHLAVFNDQGGLAHHPAERFAIGSHSALALYALASIERMPLTELEMADAGMVMHSVLQDAIRVSAGELGDPIQIAYLTAEHGVQVLDEAELQGLRDAVRAWRERQFEALFGDGEPADGASGPDIGIDPSEG